MNTEMLEPIIKQFGIKPEQVLGVEVRFICGASFNRRGLSQAEKRVAKHSHNGNGSCGLRRVVVVPRERVEVEIGTGDQTQRLWFEPAFPAVISGGLLLGS